MSLLYRFSPDDLRIILVDPKVVELQVYNGLPHLVVPVVTEPKKVLMALRWVVNEMERRYRLMAAVNVRNVGGFNARPTGKPKAATPPPEPPADTEEVDGDAVAEDDAPLLTRMSVNTDEPIPDKLPYIVVIIDELADLMQTAPKDVEHAIQRISQKARAAGIHLILATQTPRRQVVTGVIKTNIPCRIAFRVPNGNDSRVILDENGAENLLGKGDMLYLAPGASKLVRASGAFVSDQEVVDVVEFVRAQGPVRFETEIHDKLNGPGGSAELDPEDEELYQRCVDVVLDEAKASTSLLQRRLGLGYGRAAKFMDVLFERGVIGPENGSKPREVLIQQD